MGGGERGGGGDRGRERKIEGEREGEDKEIIIIYLVK